MDDKPIGRAEFFKYVFGKATSAAFQLAEDLVDPLKKAGEMAQAIHLTPVLPVHEYHGKPQLITSSNPPVYLVGEIGKNLTAFSAICEKDGFITAYLPQEHVLYCSACGSKHALTYGDEVVETTLKALRVVVKDDVIYLSK